MKKRTGIELLLCAVFFAASQYPSTVCAAAAKKAKKAEVVVNCGKKLCDISPLIFGHNLSDTYYPPGLDSEIIARQVKEAGITLLRFPPGACGNRYDFKYNNYKGRIYWQGKGWEEVRSLEDELRFCEKTGAQAIVQVNADFQGPNGTGTNRSGKKVYGMDYASYTGCYLPDTPENRAKYAVDMLVYIRGLCKANNWKFPKYYDIGNEYMFDGQTLESYKESYKAYSAAMKAVEPDIILLPGLGEKSMIRDFRAPGPGLDLYNIHTYLTSNVGTHNINLYVYQAGQLDGSFPGKLTRYSNIVREIRDAYNEYLPGIEPKFAMSEWGDHWSYDGAHFGEYMGAIFEAHCFYRLIKNKFVLACAWNMWAKSDTNYHLFSGPPEYRPRPRYFVYVLYKNFGDVLLECYDPREYKPRKTDFFKKYKDDRDDLLVQASLRSDGNISIMATNLSESTTYQSRIKLNDFDMSGKINAYVMDRSNCYENGPGPSNVVLTKNASPFDYTFYPFTVTCLVVEGKVKEGEK
jgi:hypothetical protein